jgi:hypothetical protein
MGSTSARPWLSSQIGLFPWRLTDHRVNDTVGHTTCLVCALKSHILQTRLTGHTTCETCAPKVTNRSVIRFFVKPIIRGQLDFFAFNPLAENYVVQFHSSNFLREVNCKKKSKSRFFFTGGNRNFRLPWNLKNLVNLLDEIIQTNFEFWIFLRRTNTLDIQIWAGFFTSLGGSNVILDIRGLKFESHSRHNIIFSHL